MKDLLESLKFPLVLAALISTGVNALMLVSPIFMMQVFDRVIMSGNLDTLYSLTVIAVIALILLGAFETLREQVLNRAGDWLERRADERIIDGALVKNMPADHAFYNVGAVKRFFCAKGVFSLLDAPWVFIFAALLWWMHPLMGTVAITGAVLLSIVALLTELTSRKPLTDSQVHERETKTILSSALRNSDAVTAMGMSDALKSRWHAASINSKDLQALAAQRAALFSGLAKSIRLIVQTGIMACGAYLVLNQQLSAGGMIAGSILLGRCLAPVEQAIGSWKGFVAARNAWAELSGLKTLDPQEKPIDLPSPSGQVEICELNYQPDPQSLQILHDINLSLKPGELICLVGPSGCGKTTLTKLIVGALMPSSGEVKLDGREITGWNRIQLGPSIGYLPQAIELLPGSLKDNIQRFGPGDDDGVILAAKRAGVDELIRGFKEGYETKIDPMAAPILSAGQLQRVGLARALYGDPKLVILDEPNSNLDAQGELALSKAVEALAKRGACVLMVSHRPALLKVASKIVVMQSGRIIGQGPAQDMLTPRAVETSPAQRVNLTEHAYHIHETQKTERDDHV